MQDTASFQEPCHLLYLKTYVFLAFFKKLTRPEIKVSPQPPAENAPVSTGAQAD
jgi:hypothetical protein